ncbi:AMP-binding protein [Nocardiopsis sp. RSe5-2]|uniref:AMP-binding protein n=1 Tax=Nocardiopsis endophytica TaxID=3018445 RepID=A0ABT4U603_9ACTN|nr:AMP-binding protein [Nocardiopsis endophytica]MDA2811782.1 AMP-binding protein [Nocardiopsis endophytica]
MPTPAQQVHDWLATYDAPTASVAHLLCDRHPGSAAAITEIGEDLEPEVHTFADLARRSGRLAAGMARLGIGPGDRVATLLDRGFDLAATAVAAWRLGAVHVPLLTALAPAAIGTRLAGARARLVVCEERVRHKLQDAGPWRVAVAGSGGLAGDLTLDGLAAGTGPVPRAEAVGGSAPFLHLYSPGPGGVPRGFEVPVRALAAFHSHFRYGLDVAQDDVYWNTHDPNWHYGLYFGLVAPLLAGHAALQLRAVPDPELVLDVLAEQQVTNLVAAPTLYRTLRSTVKTLPPEVAVRRLSSAGEPLPEGVVEWAGDVFGAPVRDHYGQAELGVCVGQHQHPDAAAEVPPGSQGTGLPGWSVAVLDPFDDVEAAPGVLGRVAVDARDSAVYWFRGYTGDPGARLTPDGRWFVTADTAVRDRQGCFFFSSRDEEAILASGYRIVPGDVETALLEHPDVVEAAVYGAPDGTGGQTVAATVVLADGAQAGPELAEKLRELVRGRFAEHAYPRTIDFVEELPKSPSGKIRRSRLGPRTRG